MKLWRSVSVVLCCLCSGQVFTRQGTHQYKQLQAAYMEQLSSGASVHDAYSITRRFLQEQQISDKDTIHRVISWFYKYAAKIDASQAKALRDTMQTALRNANYDVSAIPPLTISQQVYDAFAQVVEPACGTPHELYAAIRGFIFDHALSGEQLEEFLTYASRHLKDRVSQACRHDVKTLIKEMMLPLFERHDTYDAAQLPGTFDALCVASYMAKVVDMQDMRAVYRATKSHLNLLEMPHETQMRIVSHIEHAAVPQEQVQRLYALFDMYIRGLDQPVDQLPSDFDAAVNHVSKQYVERRFTNVDTSDATQVYNALRDALSQVSDFVDITSRWVKKIPHWGGKLNRNKVPAVVHSIYTYLHKHHVTELPKEYSGVANCKHLEEDFQKRLTMAQEYIDTIETEFTKDTPDIDLEEVADNLRMARDVLGQIWNDLVAPDNELPRTHKIHGKQIDAILREMLSTLSEHIRTWISHMAYRYPREPIATIEDWLDSIFEHQYMRTLVDELPVQSRQFAAWHREHIAYAYLRALKARCENNDTLTPEVLGGLSDTFDHKVIENLPQNHFPQFLITASYEFDVALDEYLANQITSAFDMNLTQRSSTYAAVMEKKGSSASIPALIQKFHQALPQKLQSSKFREDQLYIGYYCKNAKMMLQHGIDSARRLDRIRGNLHEIDHKPIGLAKQAYRGLIDAYNERVQDYNTRMASGERAPLSASAQQHLGALYAQLMEYNDRYGMEKEVVQPHVSQHAAEGTMHRS